MHQEPYARSPRMSSRGQQGTIRQLADGRWRARYRENGRNGKRPQATFATKAAASAWLRDRLDETARIQAGDTALLVNRREATRTVDQTCDDFLAAHDAGPGRMQILEQQLRLFRRAFGDRLLQSLEPYELQAWQKTISPGYRSEVFKTARQVLKQAVVWHWIPSNPAEGIRNPRRRRPEITPFPWAAIRLVDSEILESFDGLAAFAAGTGLRPEEWIPLQRADLDLEGRLVHVRRVYTRGLLTELGPEGTKTHRQRRSVPLRQLVLDALERRPRRIDTPLLWPHPAGGLVNLDWFRAAVWKPALTVADVEYQRIYDLRHTYATDSIAAGVDLFTLSRRMGTSLEMIDKTYGHLAGDAAERELAMLDAWDMREAQ